MEPWNDSESMLKNKELDPTPSLVPGVDGPPRAASLRFLHQKVKEVSGGERK